MKDHKFLEIVLFLCLTLSHVTGAARKPNILFF
jgi:hypothetical protein